MINGFNNFLTNGTKIEYVKEKVDIDDFKKMIQECEDKIRSQFAMPKESLNVSGSNESSIVSQNLTGANNTTPIVMQSENIVTDLIDNINKLAPISLEI